MNEVAPRLAAVWLPIMPSSALFWTLGLLALSDEPESLPTGGLIDGRHKIRFLRPCTADLPTALEVKVYLSAEAFDYGHAHGMSDNSHCGKVYRIFPRCSHSKKESPGGPKTAGACLNADAF